MCETCEVQNQPTLLGRQRRLWEIDSNWHCSVVGTCLTLGDLRRIARKLGYKPPADPYYEIDSYLHGYFVKLCGKPTIAGKMIEKTLNRRHAAAIRRIKKISSVDELAESWTQSFKDGDIPGPYWAILSHQALDLRLGSKVYNDVHMLSHLVGASNRADLSSLSRLEMELASLHEKTDQSRTRSIEKLREKDALIAEREAQIAILTGRLHSLEEERDALKQGLKMPSPPKQNHDMDRMAAQLEKTILENASLKEETNRYQSLVPALQGEISVLERALTPANCPRSNDCPLDCDLRDRCILYVGGRTRHVGQMRTMVSDWNGTLLHHDGGLDQSMDELAGAVLKADVVFFPTDCVSHKAMYRLKDLCKQTVKPYIPLRTASVSSFLDGLQRSFPNAVPVQE